MNPSLSTQIHRAVYALPLLAISIAAALGTETLPGTAYATAPSPIVIVLSAPEGGVASTLPGTPASDAATLALESLPGPDCSATRAAGTRGLSRMPGDLTTLAVRMRCAQ